LSPNAARKQDETWRYNAGVMLVGQRRALSSRRFMLADQLDVNAP
jgi:hypothetical protein